MNIGKLRQDLEGYPDDWDVQIIEDGDGNVRLSILPPAHPEVTDVGETAKDLEEINE